MADENILGVESVGIVYLKKGVLVEIIPGNVVLGCFGPKLRVYESLEIEMSSAG